MNGSSVVAARLSLLFYLTITVVTGCSDNSPELDRYQAQVRVSDERSGQPVPGVKVAVMSRAQNIPVALAVADAGGLCRFPNLAYGDYRLLAFGGNTHVVHNLPQAWRWFGKAGGQSSGTLTSPLAPQATPPAPLPPEILMRAIVGEPLPRIAGTVVDAVTGEPLAAVFLGLSPYLEGYQGDSGPEDDVTDSQGRFTVNRIPFARDPFTGNLLQITPLRVTRHGYRPLVWTYRPPNGSDNLDITGVTIRLEPLGADATGTIRGRLLLLGEPGVGVQVGLGVAGNPADAKAGPGMTGWTAVTDTSGIFTFTGLPAGTFLLHPGYLLHDGFFYPNQPGNTPRLVEPGQTTDVGDLILFREITPYHPAGGIRLAEAPRELSWSAVPDATTYRAALDGFGLAPVGESRLTLPDSLDIGPGLHSWVVSAYDADDQPLGTVQTEALFRIMDLD